MKHVRLGWLIPLSVAAATTGCSWVESSGRQNNRDPGLTQLTHLVLENRENTSLGIVDEDGNLAEFQYELIAEGGDLSAACVAAGGVLSGVAVSDFADSLEDACDPLVEQMCEQLTLESELLQSELWVVDTPILRRPVAQQYEVTLQDTDGASIEQVLTLCIASESTAPIAVSDEFDAVYNEVRVVEGMVFNELCGPDIADGVLANDSDDFDYSEDEANSQQCLVAELVSAPAGHVGVFSLDADGGFTYNAGASIGVGETDSFTYTISDGINSSTEATVTINITGENSPPVAQNPVRTINEDTNLVLNAADLATDAQGGALTLKTVAVAQAASIGVVDFDANPAQIRYQPNANASGADSFSYVIRDAGGAEASGTVTVNVSAVNDVPVVEDEEGTAVTLLTATDTDSLLFTVTDVEDDLAGAGIAVNASTSNANVVTVSVVEDIDPGTAGNWRVDFEAVANGTAVVTLSATDAAAATATESINVTVGTGNQAPTVDSPVPTLTTAMGSDLDVNIISSNVADDPDGNNSAIDIAGVTSEVGGTVSFVPGGQVLTFSPSAIGSASFTLSIVDEGGATGSGTVLVDVTAAVATDPELTGNTLAATAGSQVTYAIVGDNLATDPDGSQANLFFNTAPTTGDGDIVFAANGSSFQFTPTASATGSTATIAVVVEDGDGNSVSGDLTVTVAGAPTDPVLTGDALAATAGSQITYGIVGDNLATDPDGSQANLFFNTAPTTSDGDIVFAANGSSFQFTPTASATGSTATIAVVVEDGDGNSVSGSLTINVAGDP